MTAKRWRIQIVGIGLALAAATCVLLFGRNPSTTAAQDKGKPDLTQAEFYGASACGRCHEVPGNSPIDFVMMTEFTTWRSKDKHALAYLVLEGPRGQQMAKLLGIDVKQDPKCLNCHSTISRPARKNPSFTIVEGVSCDGCHGPAENWMLKHAFDPSWRNKTPEQKADLGMYDVRNPVKRTQLCMSCHVGNAAEGKVVTHAMYAAGHPPLPSFEAASFSVNMPPHWKDWKDLKDTDFFKKADAKVRTQNYLGDAEFQQTKLVLATCSESLRTMMALVNNRATLSGKPEAAQSAWPPPWFRPYAKNDANHRWPELPKETKEPSVDELQGIWPEIAMAQSDCYACHHDLKSKSWRQMRGYAGKPGRPQLQPWVFALAPISLPGEADMPDLTTKFKKLTTALDGQPFGVPSGVAAAAFDLQHFAAKMLQPTATVTRDTAHKLLQKLLARGSADYVDYDSARQLAWATRVVFSELNQNHPKGKAIEDLLSQLDNELNLTLESNARKKSVSERHDLTKDLAKADLAAKAKDEKFLTALQKINDQELANALVVIGNYEPALFKDRMKALSALIGHKE